ncbi:hypothetical protein BS17DRAFT_456364 [Gyrodon lividus]|nr:hypothetical protein BS17DRAFT_456364 [Gyrodon lividus]
MVRGRKKDLTIPPSRALIQQRDYRARKAQYLCELQQRCARAEQENVRLRRELEIARAASNVPSPEVILASRDLMEHLADLSASISRFQQVAQSRTSSPLSSGPGLYFQPAHSNTHHSTSVPQQPQPSLGSLRPASFPSPASLLSKLPPIDPPLMRPETHILAPLQNSEHSHSHSQLPDSQWDARSTPARNTPDTCPSPSPSLGSECCGGYVDCAGLVDEGECEACAGTSATCSRTPENR